MLEHKGSEEAEYREWANACFMQMSFLFIFFLVPANNPLVNKCYLQMLSLKCGWFFNLCTILICDYALYLDYI